MHSLEPQTISPTKETGRSRSVIGCSISGGPVCCDAVAGTTSTVQRPPGRGEPVHTQEIFLALGVTVRRLQLPSVLLEDLLSAFRQDVTVTRYDTWAALLDYCRRSANPIGRLVLRIGGYAAHDLDSWSDAICTALQLTNFWQDVKSDYAPRPNLSSARRDARARGGGGGPRSRDGSRRNGGTRSPRRLLRTRALFTDGLPLCDRLGGRLRYEIRATWLGGTRILDRIEAVHFDVLNHRPTIGAADIAVAGGRGARVAEVHRAASRGDRHEPRHQLLLLLSGAAAAQAQGDRRGLGFLPGSGRCGR